MICQRGFVTDFTLQSWDLVQGWDFLTAVQAWLENDTKGHLNFTSFEAYPMSANEMARALSLFPELGDLAALLVAQWDGKAQVIKLTEHVTLEVIFGDARETLPHWQGKADAWFLDGFSPARNPELWSPELMQEVGAHTAPSGTVATYTAAGFVRRGLMDAGFDVERIKGFGRKRHMTVASFKGIKL